MESLFSSLKIERAAHKTYKSRDEAKADLFDYIERSYNPDWPEDVDYLPQSRWRNRPARRRKPTIKVADHRKSMSKYNCKNYFEHLS